jgi:hypothetical protein
VFGKLHEMNPSERGAPARARPEALRPLGWISAAQSTQRELANLTHPLVKRWGAIFPHTADCIGETVSIGQGCDPCGGYHPPVKLSALSAFLGGLLPLSPLFVTTQKTTLETKSPVTF